MITTNVSGTSVTSSSMYKCGIQSCLLVYVQNRTELCCKRTASAGGTSWGCSRSCDCRTSAYSSTQYYPHLWGRLSANVPQIRKLSNQEPQTVPIFYLLLHVAQGPRLPAPLPRPPSLISFPPPLPIKSS